MGGKTYISKASCVFVESRITAFAHPRAVRNWVPHPFRGFSAEWVGKHTFHKRSVLIEPAFALGEMLYAP
jgi:hypothetical protein